MYVLHPSSELQRLFRQRPFQGAHPFEAKVIFVGLDANYGSSIAAHVIFPRVVEYHADGVGFWKNRGVHHPFLLPGYRGDGRFFHSSFSQMGLGVEYADAISFVELLHVPTVGRNRLHPSDLDGSHLGFIDHAVVHGDCRLVFLSSSVERLMRQARRFTWLGDAVDEAPLSVLHASADKRVYRHLHFSTYGRFAQRKCEQAVAMASLIRAACEVTSTRCR